MLRSCILKRQFAQHTHVCLHACKDTLALHASPLPHLEPAQQLAPARPHSWPRGQWTRKTLYRTTALVWLYHTPCLAVFGPTELHIHRRCPAAQQWRIRELQNSTQIELVCGECRVAVSGVLTMDIPTFRETSMQCRSSPAGRMGQEPIALEMQCIMFFFVPDTTLCFAAFAVQRGTHALKFHGNRSRC